MPQRVLRQPNRDHYQTIKQILQNVYTKAGGCRATELAYRSELTWKQFIEYRDLLTSRRLLIPSDNEATQHYEITPCPGCHNFAEVSISDDETIVPTPSL
jgi:predicted transcriptional regulator